MHHLSGRRGQAGTGRTLSVPPVTPRNVFGGVRILEYPHTRLYLRFGGAASVCPSGVVLFTVAGSRNPEISLPRCFNDVNENVQEESARMGKRCVRVQVCSVCYIARGAVSTIVGIKSSGLFNHEPYIIDQRRISDKNGPSRQSGTFYRPYTVGQKTRQQRSNSTTVQSSVEERCPSRATPD